MVMVSPMLMFVGVYAGSGVDVDVCTCIAGGVDNNADVCGDVDVGVDYYGYGYVDVAGDGAMYVDMPVVRNGCVGGGEGVDGGVDVCVYVCVIVDVGVIVHVGVCCVR